MATSLTDVQTQAIGLSKNAFDVFCHDISGMFGVGMECKQQENTVETVSSLTERFKKLVAVNSVKAEGAMDGTFQLIFDQEGLLILSGIIVMLPSTNILQRIKRGTVTDIDGMTDAIKEVGNMLVGSWDKVFREGLEKHGHFAQTDTFIGNPWDNPKGKIGLGGDEEFLFIPYQMTIDSYPAFNCGVIFPGAVFDKTQTEEKIRAEVRAKLEAEAAEKAGPEPEEEAEAETEEKPNIEAEMKATIEAEERARIEAEMKATIEAEEKAKAEAEMKAKAEAEQKAEADKKAEAEAAADTKADDADTAASEDAVEPQQVETPEPTEDTEPADDAEPTEDTEPSDGAEPTEDTEPAEATEPAPGAVSETIQKMVQSPAGLPGEHLPISLAICAKDIMQKDILWGSADDGVQQAMEKMQQADAGHMMVGTEGLLEGIVSRSDIAAAVSVYLRPMFAKWRRPTDDATLQIRIKWIMTRPVQTIEPDISLAEIMTNMRQSGLRCLPVVDKQAKVVGSVTVFDIFAALLNTDSNMSTAGKTPQAPPLD